MASQRAAKNFMLGSIRCLTERTVNPMYSGAVQRLMSGVEAKARKQPGLMTLEILQDRNDRDKYMILTEWQSYDHWKAWVDHPTYQKLNKDLEELLKVPTSYRLFRKPQDDIFLL